MSQLADMLKVVREEGATKTQLEDYFTQLSGFYSDLQIEIAQHKKEKALFEAGDPNVSVAKAKVLWKASPSGQRLIELEGYSRATATQLRSLKNRLYAIY